MSERSKLVESSKFKVLISSILKWSKTRVASHPFIIGVNGPQGSGKSLITKLLSTVLEAEHRLKTVTLCLDDLYLTHDEQTTLARKFLGNKLLEFRGNPGTHDIQLGMEILELLHGNKACIIPSYDKSLHNGRGDRLGLEKGRRIVPPYDIVLFEGWSVGFVPVDESHLELMYQNWKSQSFKYEFLKVAFEHVNCHPFSHISTMNSLLSSYTPLWDYIDAMIILQPTSISMAYGWRLEQENDRPLESRLTKAQVHDFVDRFMPAYALYIPGLIESKLSLAPGRYLMLQIDENREFVENKDYN